jgi:hypothetical protein
MRRTAGQGAVMIGHSAPYAQHQQSMHAYLLVWARNTTCINISSTAKELLHLHDLTLRTREHVELLYVILTADSHKLTDPHMQLTDNSALLLLSHACSLSSACKAQQ